MGCFQERAQIWGASLFKATGGVLAHALWKGNQCSKFLVMMTPPDFGDIAPT
jgi:hypothetical protein